MTQPRDQNEVSAAGVLSSGEVSTFDATEVVNGVLTVTTRTAPDQDRTYVVEGRLTVVEGVGYAPEAVALFARMSTQPSAAQKTVINNRIVQLKAAGLFAKMDALWVYAAHSQQAALLNWIQDAYNCTVSGSVTFTVNIGITGAGGYLETGFNPATASGAKFVQNSGAIGFWSQTAGQANTVEMGNNNTLLQVRTTGDVFNHRVNAGTSGSVITVADGTGLFVSSRTGSAAADNLPYRDGVALTVNNNPAVSATPESAAFRVLGRGGASPSVSARQCSLAFVSSGLSAQEIADLYDIFA